MDCCMGFLHPLCRTLYLPLLNFSRTVKERVEIQRKMRKKYAKNQSWRKKQGKDKMFWKAKVKKGNKNMDEKEVKKYACIFVAVVLLYCICILVIYHRIIDSMSHLSNRVKNSFHVMFQIPHFFLQWLDKEA